MSTLTKAERSELRRLLREALPSRDKFIRDNFCLASLKKVGFLIDTKDMDDVAERIKRFFGLKSIFEYKQTPPETCFRNH